MRTIGSSFAACGSKQWKTTGFRKPVQRQAPYPRLKRGTLDVATPRRLFFGRPRRVTIESTLRMRTSARRPKRPRCPFRGRRRDQVKGNRCGRGGASKRCALAATTQPSCVARSTMPDGRTDGMDYDLPFSLSGVEVLVGGGLALALDDLSEFDALGDGVELEGDDELGLD